MRCSSIIEFLLSSFERVRETALNWLMIIMILVVTLVVPTYIESLF